MSNCLVPAPEPYQYIPMIFRIDLIGSINRK